MCSPAASTPHIGKHIHTQRQTWTHKSKGPGRKRNLGRDCSFQLPLLDEESSSLTSVFPHSQDGGILLGKKEREGSFRAMAFSVTAGRRAFHSCAHLDQTGPKFEEQRFPREDRVTVCTRFV